MAADNLKLAMGSASRLASSPFMRAEVALGGLVLAGDAAGELLADPRHALQVTFRLAADVPGLDVSVRDLRERGFLQFRISQKPLERGVFTLKPVEPRDPPARPGSVTREPKRQSSGRANGEFQGRDDGRQ